jgi:hypothetical protein
MPAALAASIAGVLPGLPPGSGVFVAGSSVTLPL